MNQIISAIVNDLNGSYPANGQIWKKTPDEYDETRGIIWEGEWVLENEYENKFEKFENDYKVEKKYVCDCPNAHMGEHYCYNNCYPKKNLIKEEQMRISNTFNPHYHNCNHKTHKTCSNSPCCDVIWHGGICKYVTDDGECGYAVRLGDQ